MTLVRATVLVTVVAAAVALLGVFSAHAEEGVLHFYVCRFEPGLYDTNACNSEPQVLLQYHRTTPGSSPEEVKSEGAKSFELETTISGNSTLITCTTQKGPGTIWNPEPFSTSNGKGAAKAITYEGCAVSKPTGCEIPGKKVVTNELQATLEESKAFGRGAKFTPASGETFAEVTFEKCAKGELNKKYAVKGSAFGIAKLNQVEFTNASSSLTFGGNEALFRGLSSVVEPEGNNVLVQP